jgi:methylmalonyl-CoA/ethylmalonyl-CoA epimerase
MVTGIDHIGILVSDLDAALRFYAETLGLPAGPVQALDDPPIRRACIRVGDVELELIEAADAERTMLRFLPHRHAGIYHVGFRVDDVDATARELRGEKVPLIDEVREGDEMRIQFLHPDAAQGTLIELVQRKARRKLKAES